MPRWSTRVRVTLAATVVVAAGLGLASWVLLLTLQHELSRAQDDTARARARDLAALTAAGSLPDPIGGFGEDTIAQVVDGSGHVLAATPGLDDRPAVTSFVPVAGKPEARTVTVPDGRELEPYRVWGVAGRGPDGRVVIYVGSSLELVSEAVATLRGLLALGVPLLALLIGAGTWLVLGRTLRPVEEIRTRVAAISDADLDQRVPEPATGDEIARLARTMNAMLGRLAEASRRQRAFASDASHELQSPLARLRSQLEVGLAHPDDTDWPALARDLLTDSAEMERLVRDLLFLAREEDRPSVALRRDLVDLDDVVLEEAARLRAGGRVRLDTSAVSAAPVRGSREELSRLVRNLLENAQQHAATSVVVSLGAEDGAAELVVADDGPGVPAEDRARIFDRFVRLDRSRSRESGGTGLGLAIVAAVADRHAGTVAVRDNGEGAAFVLRLPAATP